MLRNSAFRIAVGSLAIGLALALSGTAMQGSQKGPTCKSQHPNNKKACYQCCKGKHKPGSPRMNKCKQRCG
jgi:hypothetical protein